MCVSNSIWYYLRLVVALPLHHSQSTNELLPYSRTSPCKLKEDGPRLWVSGTSFRGWKIAPVETSPRTVSTDRTVESDLETPKGQSASPSLLETDSRPSLPRSHLHQNILALSREQIFEPVEGEVVRHADGRARGVTHMVRAVPLPVPTDTRNNNGQDDQWVLWCEGPFWALGNERQ